jgi:transcriptional regulator with XRE-family HTH domain
MAGSNAFGEFFKEKRLALGLALREFCRENGLDWGNVSRIERGVSAPPKSDKALEAYAKALRLKPGTEDWTAFFDLAAISAGVIPDAVMKDEALVAKLPLVFRTIQGKKLTEKQLRDLSEVIRKA